MKLSVYPMISHNTLLSVPPALVHSCMPFHDAGLCSFLIMLVLAARFPTDNLWPIDTSILSGSVNIPEHPQAVRNPWPLLAEKVLKVIGQIGVWFKISSTKISTSCGHGSHYWDLKESVDVGLSRRIRLSFITSWVWTEEFVGKHGKARQVSISPLISSTSIKITFT